MAAVKLRRSYYNSNSGVPPLQHSLLELLDIRGDTEPNREAYVIRDVGQPRQSITFGDLKRRTQQLAAAFIQQGLQKGERVALLCPTSIEHVLCEYAVARTGAIVVKVHSSFRAGEDLKYLLTKSGARWLIAHPGGVNYELLKTIIPELGSHDSSRRLEAKELPDLETIFILGEEEMVGTVPLKSLIDGDEYDLSALYRRQALVTNDDIQTIVTTSGSTGYPKLVSQPYTYGMNGWRNAFMRNGITEKDVMVTDRPMTYAGGMTGPAFGTGYTMVYVVTRAVVGAGSEGSEFMIRCAKEEKGTVMMMFPYLLTDVVRMGKQGKLDMGDVRIGFVSGQALPREFFSECLNIIPNCLPVFGSTEADVFIGAHLDDPSEKKLSTAGVPVDGEAKIVDEHGNIVPVNTPGELCLRNKNLFVKYWGDDELTNKVKSSEGWYRSGDMAIMDEEGYVTSRGRKQEIISRATIKVYPITFENVISKHPKVALVMVVGVPDVRVNEEVCACVVVQEGASLTEEELRGYCDGIFGVEEDGVNFGPKYYVFLDRFPCGPTGKIDRKRVAQMAVEKLGLKQAY